MNLKKMYNITIYGMIALLVCTMSMMIYFNMLVSRSENVNKNRTELITLSNETLHNNNYLVKLMRLFIVSNDPAIREEYTNILMDESNLNGKLDRMAEIGLTSSEQTYVDEMWLLLDKLAAIEDSAFAAFDGGDTAAAANIIHSDEYTQADAKLAEHTENLIEEISNRTGSEIENIQTQTEITLLVISIIIFAAICSFIAIQIKQKDRVLNPIRDIQAIINRVAKGETNIRVRKKYYDEIGVMYDHINEMIKSITEQSQIIEKVAAGDLTVDIVPKSENDTMGFALKRMLDDLNRTFGEISSNTSHVSSGSSHIAVVAKNLTECVSEQVMAIDELSGAVSQITEQIKENTAMAEKATELAGMIKED
ncbi:MAG: methyl-accepting chemotaxis protein, partial [Eubacterium sp.]|nr:methyl-accepting chemotaxis protein [Eubacterium sp.]